MKKWWIIIIIVLIILGITLTFYLKSDNSTITQESPLTFTSSKDTGQEIGKATDANSFDDVKLNPFEENE